MWQKLWWRVLCICGLVIVINIVVPLLAIAVSILRVHPDGVLDFAGGSVVHIGPLALFLAAPWLAVEAHNLRRRTPVPFGSYIAFAVAFAVSLRMTGYVSELPRTEWGGAGTLFPVIVFIVSGGAGLAAGWTYARLARKTPRPEANF